MAAEGQAQIFARAPFVGHSCQRLLSFHKSKGFLGRSNSPAEFAHRRYGAFTQCTVKTHFRFQPQPTQTMLATVPQVFSSAQLACARGNIIIREEILSERKCDARPIATA